MKSTIFVAALAYAMFGMTIASPMSELDTRQANDGDVSHLFRLSGRLPNA